MQNKPTQTYRRPWDVFLCLLGVLVLCSFVGCNQKGKMVPVSKSGDAMGAMEHHDTNSDCDNGGMKKDDGMQGMGLHGDEEEEASEAGTMGDMSGMDHDDMDGMKKDDASTNSSSDTMTSGMTMVSYNQDISPLFKQKCVSCHYPGTDEGPDLSTYELVKKKYEEIDKAVRLKPKSPGFMPEGGSALTDKELALLADWKSGGMVKGTGTVTTDDCKN